MENPGNTASKQEKRYLKEEADLRKLLESYNFEDSVRFFNNLLVMKSRKDIQDRKLNSDLVTLDEYSTYHVLEEHKYPKVASRHIIRHINNVNNHLIEEDHIYSKFILRLYGVYDHEKLPNDIIETLLTMNKDFPASA